jgi:hypothetical protein
MPRTLRRALFLFLLLVCAAAACAVPALAGAIGHPGDTHPHRNVAHRSSAHRSSAHRSGARARGATEAGSAATATRAPATNQTSTSTSTTTTASTSTSGGGPSTVPAATNGSAAAAAGSVLYGLGDSEGEFARCVNATDACCYGDPTSCPVGSVTGFWSDPWFKALTSVSSAHRVSFVRLFVSIDAVSQFNGSAISPGCGPSQVLQQSWYDTAGRLHSAGESLQDLMAGLAQAHADGLTPLVSITGYAVPSSRPSFDAPAPDPTTPTGYWDYRCGVDGILGAISRLPADQQPHVWEPFNEPDTVALYRDSESADADPSCAVTATGVPSGPAKAACDYVLADQLIHQFADHEDDTLLAGVFAKMTPAYLEQYVSTLAAALPGNAFPASWAVHDYSGVTRGYLGASLSDLEAFDRQLGTDTGGRAKDLWITEAGMLLNSRTKLGDCPVNGADPAGTVGACINGNTEAQRTDIAAFFSLPQAGVSVPITHLFWYEWEGEVNWDSGLLDAAGVPRSAWCSFFGSGTCTGNPNAA